MLLEILNTFFENNSSKKTFVLSNYRFFLPIFLEGDFVSFSFERM